MFSKAKLCLDSQVLSTAERYYVGQVKFSANKHCIIEELLPVACKASLLPRLHPEHLLDDPNQTGDWRGC
jgi:hypothetical protein